MARQGEVVLFDPDYECFNRKTILRNRVFDAYSKELAAVKILTDLQWNLALTYRRLMSQIANVGSSCEVLFGQIETEIAAANTTANSNLFAITSDLLATINALDCTAPNWEASMAALLDMVDAVNRTADLDVAKASELQERLYQWTVNCLPINVSPIVPSALSVIDTSLPPPSST